MTSRDPICVLRAITRLNIGGPAKHALLLTRELESKFPTILASGRPEGDEGELSDASVRVVEVPLVRPVRPLADVRSVAALRGIMRSYRPRIVHTHMAKAGTTGRLAALSVRPRPRIVHTFHGHVLSSYFNRTSERAFIEIERRLARSSDVLVAVSPEIRDELLSFGIGRKDQFRVVPVGLDLEPFTRERRSGRFRAKLGIPSDTPLIGSVGRLVPIKNVELLLDVLVDLPDVHGAVVGDGAMRAALESRARSLGIDARVHFTGWVANTAEILGDLDAVVLTSDNEGTPLAVIEALAAGRPVVATDVGGVRSVVRDGLSGLLCPPRDPARLADALRRVLRDGPAAKAMGEAGRADVLSRFGANRLVEDVGRLYAELLASR